MNKLFLSLALSGILAAGPAWAQQSSSARGGLSHARIKCNDEPYVSVTADPERALPLQVVAKAVCNERVTIVSDSQDYTVRVVTADGSVGYVTRYQLVLEPATKSSVATQPVSASTNGGAPPQPHQTNSPPKPGPAPDDKTSSKPRVFISDSQSWAESGGFSNSTGPVPGYNPEMVDVYQDFTSDCSAVAVVQDKANADYAILFDKGTSKKGLTGLGGLVKVNKVTVLSRTGETLLSRSSHSADAAVKAACDAVAQKAAPNHTQPAKPVQ